MIRNPEGGVAVARYERNHPSGLKPAAISAIYGTTEVVPCYKAVPFAHSSDTI